MQITYAQALALAIEESLTEDADVFLIGGGFMGLDPQARKSLDRISERFSDRIMTTSISELALAGAGIGAAVCGQRPLVDLSTGSFIFQAFAQVVNEAANIHYMTGGQTTAPVTFHSLGGIRGAGAAQHSHRTQAMFGQVPGLQVFVPGAADDAYALMKWALRKSRTPTAFISHALLLNLEGELDRDAELPVGKARIRREGDDVTIVCSSITVPKAMAAARALADGPGVSAEVVDLRTVTPLDRDTIVRSVSKTGRLVVADECHVSFGVAAEVVATVSERASGKLKASPIRVAVPDVPIPFSAQLEAELTVTSEKIVAAALKTLGR